MRTIKEYNKTLSSTKVELRLLGSKKQKKKGGAEAAAATSK